MVSKVHFSSNSNEWETPDNLFAALNAEFNFTLDVCATPANAKCKKFFTQKDDALQKKWSASNWMNPPYGTEIQNFMLKAVIEAKRGNLTVCLVPARTDTKWWGYIWNHATHQPQPWTREIRFIRGRLKFKGAKYPAPFPSAIIVLSKPNYASLDETNSRK